MTIKVTTLEQHRKKSMWKFQGSTKKEVTFPGRGVQEKIMWNFHGSCWFLMTFEFPKGCPHNFAEFPARKLVFSNF